MVGITISRQKGVGLIAAARKTRLSEVVSTTGALMTCQCHSRPGTTIQCKVLVCASWGANL